jgi:cytochrome P450
MVYDADAMTVSMNRKVMCRLTLSDGTILPKGARLMVAGRFRDPEIYENPDVFDAARFLKLRVGGSSNNAHQYVSTSADMFAFGMACIMITQNKELVAF